MSDEAREAAEVKRGQVWKFGWMFVTVRKAGPKVVEVKSERGDPFRVPRERFLQRFHLTGVAAIDALGEDER